jgi:hypothetical protein
LMIYRVVMVLKISPDLVPVFLLPYISKEADDFITLVKKSA